MKREPQTLTRSEIIIPTIKQTGDHVITPIRQRMKQQASLWPNSTLWQLVCSAQTHDVQRKKHLIFQIELLANPS